jgi:hypothetical protein
VHHTALGTQQTRALKRTRQKKETKERRRKNEKPEEKKKERKTRDYFCFLRIDDSSPCVVSWLHGGASALLRICGGNTHPPRI